ncbi:MAG: MmcQ/YjbR family DNA-binding protein [Actinomycetota bacterium]
MFDDDDPWLARVRDLVGQLPGADVKVSHGRPAFFTTKVFCYFGGAIKLDGTWVQHPHSIVVLPDPEDRLALLDDDRVYVPAYLGPSGWLGVDLDGLDPSGGDAAPRSGRPDGAGWAEVAELLDASYRLTAPARLVAELDRVR